MTNEPDLFEWAAAQPKAAQRAVASKDATSADVPPVVINFRERRDQLARWKLFNLDWWLNGLARCYDREDGILPPAPILQFVPRMPATKNNPETPQRQKMTGSSL